jgi:hypothetical protein
MAYRGLGMVELRELVRRWQAGEGVRATAGAGDLRAEDQAAAGAAAARAGDESAVANHHEAVDRVSGAGEQVGGAGD